MARDIRRIRFIRSVQDDSKWKSHSSEGSASFLEVEFGNALSFCAPDTNRRSIHGMTFAIIGSQIRQPSNELITLDDEITRDVFEEVEKAKETCLLALELEEKLNLLLDNAYEFEIELLKLAQASLMWQVRKHADAMRDRLLLDRRLVNLLTACRLYLDHSGHAVSTLFGTKSGERDRVREAKNKAYDEVFGYRFMETLRNYVQHRGLGVHVISYTASGVTKNSVEWEQRTVVPLLDVARLNDDRKIKASILEEIRKLGPHVDLRLWMRDYIWAIVQLQNEIREMIASAYSDRFAFYRGFVSRYKERGGLPVIGPEVIEKDAEGIVTKECALVDEFIDNWEFLKEKNAGVLNLRKMFASNMADGSR